MMKKLLLTIVFAISGIILINAQCTPDTTCNNLVCPDTATNLPHVASIAIYSTTMTVKVPADTTVPILGTVPIDSLTFTSVTGLPAGFTMKPNKTGWNGGTRGCVEITGTPAESMRGITYNLTITTTAHALSGGASVPIPLAG